jgi:hypothetical protein
MDVPMTEEQIRNLAYRLWEEAGSPEGMSDEFWLRAQQQLQSEPGMGSTDASKPSDGPAVMQ